jgi:hypothetical protein
MKTTGLSCMAILTALAIAPVSFVRSEDADRKPVDNERRLLFSGTWEMISSTIDGKSIAADPHTVSMEFANGKMIHRVDLGTKGSPSMPQGVVPTAFKYSLRRDDTSYVIDFDSEPHKWSARYRIKGDTLEICYVTDTNVNRPSDVPVFFEAKKGSGVTLEIYKRQGRCIPIEDFSDQMRVTGWELATEIPAPAESRLENVSIDGRLLYVNCTMRESFGLLDPTINVVLTAKDNAAGFRFLLPKKPDFRCSFWQEKVGAKAMDLLKEAITAKKSDQEHSTKYVEMEISDGVEYYLVPAQKRIEFFVKETRIASYFSYDDVILVKYRRAMKPKK